MKSVVAVLLCFGLPILAGAIGSVASLNAREFYAALERPSWSPPGWVFGPVWTALYLMMGVAAFLVWRARGWTPLLTFFAVHLVFNALWSWIFFAWRSGAWSFADIVLLWLMIAFLVIAFWRIRPLAGTLLVPYWGWVTFASALNYAIWKRNGM
jgi:tryptophan-rich sensory protein